MVTNREEKKKCVYQGIVGSDRGSLRGRWLVGIVFSRKIMQLHCSSLE